MIRQLLTLGYADTIEFGRSNSSATLDIDPVATGATATLTANGREIFTATVDYSLGDHPPFVIEDFTLDLA